MQRLRFDWGRGALEQDIAQLPEKIYATALEVIRDRAELMRDLWKINARVDTGSYRDSIRMQWQGTGRRICVVRAGGYIVNPKTGRLVDYAAILEAKYHTGQQAYDAAFAEIEMMIESRVAQEVRR